MILILLMGTIMLTHPCAQAQVWLTGLHSIPSPCRGNIIVIVEIIITRNIIISSIIISISISISIIIITRLKPYVGNICIITIMIIVLFC